MIHREGALVPFERRGFRLVAVYLGHRYFQERNVRRRLGGAAIMMAGAILIVTLGRRS